MGECKLADFPFPCLFFKVERGLEDRWISYQTFNAAIIAV